MTGLWVALAAIAVALAFGAYRARTDGRFRGPHAVKGAVPGGLDTPSPSGSGYSTSGDQSAGRAATSASPAGRAASASERVETSGSGAPGGVSEAPGGLDSSSPSGSGRSTNGATAWSQLGDATGSTAPGQRATLVQFSSAFCAPCRVTRRVLSEVADVVPGVVHVEIDAEHHLDVVRRLGIVRTPTTLILDRTGREVARAAGAPRKEQVLAAIPAADLT